MIIISANVVPEVGGPSRFVSEFSKWLDSLNLNYQIIATTPEKYFKKNNSMSLISRKQNLIFRILHLVFLLWKNRKNSRILVCGLFYEVGIARSLFKFQYVAKVPSDIVWDKAINNGWTTYSVDEFQNNIPKRLRIYRFMYSNSLKRAEAVIVPSEHLRRLVSDWGVNPKNIYMIRNSTNLFENSINLEGNKSFDVVVVGRLIPIKGIREVLELSKKLNLSVAVIGDGPDLEYLKNFASLNAIKANFFGNVSFITVQHIICKSKYFILNSQHEGSPNALIEAFALGALCIVRENPGTAELVSDLENGILVGQNRSLESGISLALKNPELCQKISSNAKEFALKNLNRDVNFEKILNLVKPNNLSE